MYYRCVKKLTYKYDSQETNDEEISSDFLCPAIDLVKVTQYRSEAIIIVKGQKLWFVHSMNLPGDLPTKVEPFQTQELSVSFKAMVDKDFDWTGTKVTVLSHFSEGKIVGVSVESNVSTYLIHSKLVNQKLHVVLYLEWIRVNLYTTLGFTKSYCCLLIFIHVLYCMYSGKLSSIPRLFIVTMSCFPTMFARHKNYPPEKFTPQQL